MPKCFSVAFDSSRSTFRFVGLAAVLIMTTGLFAGCVDDGTPGYTGAAEATNTQDGTPPTSGTDGVDGSDTPPVTEPPVTEPPVTEPPVTEPPVTEPPVGCQYSEVVEPKFPQPSGACRTNWLSESGDVVQYAETKELYSGSSTSLVTTVFTAEGEPRIETTTTTGEFGVVYEANLDFERGPMATLECTYGQPATWATTTTWTPHGVVKRAHDIGADGVVESSEEWDIDEVGNVIEHRRFTGGDVHWRETFRPDGQPIEAVYVDADGVVSTGTFWTYDAAGLLTMTEKVSSGLIRDRAYWTWFGVGKPAEWTAFVIDGSGEEHFDSDQQWEYDGEIERVITSSRMVYGHHRTQRIELDDLGRQTLFIENTEDSDCHQYRKVMVYQGDTLIQSKTTCDGAFRGQVDVTLDDAGRVLENKRVYNFFSGGTTKTTVQTYTYDECGANVFYEQNWDGKITKAETPRTRRHGSHPHANGGPSRG